MEVPDSFFNTTKYNPDFKILSRVELTDAVAGIAIFTEKSPLEVRVPGLKASVV